MNHSTSHDSTRSHRGWIVSPWFDLAFIVNVWWLLALLPATRGVSASQDTAFDLWQIYFVIAPHRWITLVLVATDPDRREGRQRFFLGIALIAAVGVALAAYGFGSLRCVVLVDFLWNAWHFASQHGGILRMYGRMAGGGRPLLERWGLRVFITYTNLRAAGWATGWTEQVPAARTAMLWLDGIVMVPALVLLVLELIDRPWERPGKSLYLLSVMGLYGLLLASIRGADPRRAILMASATSAFHSVEYLAIVSFYAMRRQSSGSPQGLFRLMARQWVRVLAIYMLVLGFSGLYLDRYYHEWFLGINLWAAFLHYAYDGMIWKLRRPETARTLNVELPGTAAG